MGRSTKTLRLEDDIDEWLDKFSEDEQYNRSDVANRAIAVYATKMAKGEWTDPKFQDRIDEMMDDL